MIRAKLVDVGRERFNGEINFGSFRTLNSEIQKHLRSKDWALSFNDGDATATIVLVGRNLRIGMVELINAKFKQVTEDTADVIPT